MIHIETNEGLDITDLTAGVMILVTSKHRKEFNELVQRATNNWPDASNEIKKFADLITNGKLMQDYDSQTTTNKPAIRNPS